MSDSRLASSALKIGLVVNPMAGLGGAAGLQGSDGPALQREALKRHGVPRGPERLAVFFHALTERVPGEPAGVKWLTWGGAMGADALDAAGVTAQVLGAPDPHSTATDTRLAIERLCDSGIDLLVFVGGDGTARDVLASVSEQTCVLGLPAGVKMHSGVFAISPVAAAEVSPASVGRSGSMPACRTCGCNKKRARAAIMCASMAATGGTPGSAPSPPAISDGAGQKQPSFLCQPNREVVLRAPLQLIKRMRADDQDAIRERSERSGDHGRRLARGAAAASIALSEPPSFAGGAPDTFPMTVAITVR